MELGTLGTGQACKAEPFREGDKEEEEREKGREDAVGGCSAK